MDFETINEGAGNSAKFALTSINPVNLVAGVANKLDRFLDISAAPSAPALGIKHNI